MLYPDQIQAGREQVQFSLAVLDGARLQPLTTMPERSPAVTAPALRPYEINVSGSQVLVGVLSGLGAIGLLVWAVIRLWLFGE